MVDINTFLLMLLYILGAVLLICLIVLVIKSISTINRVNIILDNVDNKMIKLDKAFNLIDAITDNMALITDTVIDSTTRFIRKFFPKRTIRKEDENNNE